MDAKCNSRQLIGMIENTMSFSGLDDDKLSALQKRADNGLGRFDKVAEIESLGCKSFGLLCPDGLARRGRD